MKLLGYICLFLLIFTTSCRKDIDPEIQRFGYFRAKMNGKIWQSSYARGARLWDPYDNFAGISGNVSNKKGYLRETINFKIPIQVGYHNIRNGIPTSDLSGRVYTGSYITSQDDGDAGCDYYDVLEENENNWVEITFYDDATKIIKGRFQATFIIDSSRPKCNPKAPDVIRFTEGIFETKLFE